MGLKVAELMLRNRVQAKTKPPLYCWYHESYESFDFVYSTREVRELEKNIEM